MFSNAASLAIPICLAALSILLYPFVRYLSDKKDLRRFPAPSIAAFTPLWIFYQSLTRKRYLAVDEAHKKLGPVVRLSPEHISFSDPRAFKEIYNLTAPVVKDEFYLNLGGGVPSMFQIIGKAEHGARRKLLSHVFSATKISEMEPRVLEIVRKLFRAQEKKARGELIASTDQYPVIDGSFDIRPWFNMFSFDVITAVFWSSTYGFLDKGNDSCPALTTSGTTKDVHAMDMAHSTTNFIVPFAHLPNVWWNVATWLLRHTHGAQAAKNFRSMTRYVVSRRRASPPSEPDLFRHLPLEPSEKHRHVMTSEQVLSECSTMLSAGADTTQTSLTYLLYHLAKNPAKQTKLRARLLAALPVESQPIATYAELQKVPYLKACLDESWRMTPPLGFGLPRRTTAPGMTVGGHYIPPGVTVSSPIYTIHHDERLFQDPHSFLPERWFEQSDPDSKEDYIPSAQESANLKAFVNPFSLGSRSCIGRNLAWMDISIVMAGLIMAFEWELRDPDKELEVVEKIVTNPVALWVKAKPREGMRIDDQLERQARAR